MSDGHAYREMQKGLRGLRDAACRFADERAQGGVAPMHLAAAQGHLEAVRALLEKGASLAVQCKMVLVRAEQVGHNVCLLILRSCGPFLPLVDHVVLICSPHGAGWGHGSTQLDAAAPGSCQGG